MPEMNYIISFILTLDEIDQEKYIEADYHLSQSLFTKKMERAIQNKVKEDFSKLIEVLRDNQLDVLKVYKTFEVQNKNEFLDMWNNLFNKINKKAENMNYTSAVNTQKAHRILDWRQRISVEEILNTSKKQKEQIKTFAINRKS